LSIVADKPPAIFSTFPSRLLSFRQVVPLWRRIEHAPWPERLANSHRCIHLRSSFARMHRHPVNMSAHSGREILGLPRRHMDGIFCRSAFCEVRLDTCSDCLRDKSGSYGDADLGRECKRGDDFGKQVCVSEQDRISSFVSIPVYF